MRTEEEIKEFLRLCEGVRTTSGNESSEYFRQLQGLANMPNLALCVFCAECTTPDALKWVLEKEE